VLSYRLHEQRGKADPNKGRSSCGDFSWFNAEFKVPGQPMVKELPNFISESPAPLSRQMRMALTRKKKH
jgi:hypothetical protein